MIAKFFSILMNLSAIPNLKTLVWINIHANIEFFNDRLLKKELHKINILILKEILFAIFFKMRKSLKRNFLKSEFFLLFHCVCWDTLEWQVLQGAIFNVTFWHICKNWNDFLNYVRRKKFQNFSQDVEVYLIFLPYLQKNVKFFANCKISSILSPGAKLFQLIFQWPLTIFLWSLCSYFCKIKLLDAKKN